jgi:hypothetical protein
MRAFRGSIGALAVCALWACGGSTERNHLGIDASPSVDGGADATNPDQDGGTNLGQDGGNLEQDGATNLGQDGGANPDQDGGTNLGQDGGTNLGQDGGAAQDAAAQDAAAQDAATNLGQDAGLPVDAGAPDACLTCGPPGGALWSQRWGTARKPEIGVAIGVDAADQTVVVWQIDQGWDLAASEPIYDYSISKYDALGSELWTKPLAFHGPQGGSVFSMVMALDPGGAIWVSGSFGRNAYVGGTSLVANNLTDTFLAKLDRDGNPIFAKSFPGQEGQSTNGIGCDAAGNVILGGTFKFAVDFGGPGFSLLTGNASTNAFLVKFSSAGAPVWAKSYGDVASSESLDHLAVDAAGAIYAAGSYEKIDFGAGALPQGPHSWVARFDADGHTLYAKPIGDGTATATVTSVSAAPLGHIVFTGTFGMNLDLGGGALSATGYGGIFLGEWDGGGAHVRSTAFSDLTAYLYPTLFVVATTQGTTFLTGNFEGEPTFGAVYVNLGGGPLYNASIAGAGNSKPDIFAGELTSSFAHVWSHRYGDRFSQSVEAAATGPSGNLHITGVLNSTIDFGNGPLTSAGYADGFVAVLRR